MKRKISICMAFVLLFTMIFHVNSMAAYKQDGGRYLYNETDAKSVTVKVTVSSDGIPIQAEDGTGISELEVTVPYFDLANYGLQKYYRYKTNSGGGYNSKLGVVERPTMLHLFIYMMEKYQLGAFDQDLGTGLHKGGLLDNPREEYGITNIVGDVAFSSEKPLLIATQDACSLYMTSFWGHDCNLMYFLNREYPLWKKGGTDEFSDAYVGATCDYILLEDGDSIDLGMFTDYYFYNKEGKGFLNFQQDTYTVNKGESLTVKKLNRDWGFMDTQFLTKHETIDADFCSYYIGTPDGNFYAVEDEDLSDGVTFTGFNEVGTYTIYGLKTDYCAPAVAKVNVVETKEDPIDKNPPTTEKPPVTEEATTEKTETTTESGETTQTVAAPKTVKLSKTSMTYTGKALKPDVTVVDTEGKTIPTSNYEKKYKNNKQVGKATVTVTFRGEYASYGSKTASFKILPKNTSVKKLTKGTKQIKATWQAQKTQTTGYQIQYSTSKKFTSKTTKTVTIKKNKTTSVTIKKLKAKKSYYVRIRTYKTVGKTKYVSAWSKSKSVKTK